MTAQHIEQQQVRETPIIPARRGGVTVLCAHAFFASLVGLALRLLFALGFPAPADDSRAYIELARNWADHHVYGLWSNGQLLPTDFRMPGYPAFLAGVAMVLGRSTQAIVLSQVVTDLGTCFLTAVLAYALAPVDARRRVAIAALWLAATCPFVANYTAVILTEVLTTFLATAALVSFAMGLKLDEPGSPVSRSKFSPLSFAMLGSFLAGVATLVRPEMPLLFAVGGAVCAVRWWTLSGFRKMVLNSAAIAGSFLVALAPWPARNFISMHDPQILAPRFSTMPGEYASVGYFAWTGTWLERFRDVYLNLWKVGEDPMYIEDLPAAAFDTPQEKAQIAQLFQQYNDSDDMEISPEMDREFARIARERTQRHPLRTHIQVPFQRALTIWFTPRTELLPIDGKLWPIQDEWEDSHGAFLTTAGFAVLGYLYVVLALGGIWVVFRAGRIRAGASKARDLPNLWGVALLVAYLLARTVFLTTVESPEPRYVITCYPAVLALAALLFVFPQRSSTGSG